MRHFKTLLLGLILAVSTSAAADGFAYLTVSQTDGETSYSVSQIDKITFAESQMVLHLTGADEVRLPLSSLQRMFFSATAASIQTVAESRSSVRAEGGMLRLTVAPGERVALYTTSGELLMSTTEDTTYDLGSHPRGVYIVQMGQTSRKVINK